MYKNLASEKAALIISCICLLPSLMVSYYFFPLNNGWWPFYAYLESNDLRMYVDFNNVYAPLFTRLIELLSTKSFAPVVSLTLGILRVYALYFLCIYVLKKYFHETAAILASFLIVAFQIHSPVFMPDDYHIFERTLFVLSMFVFYELLNSKDNEQKTSKLILLAVLTNLLIYSKQNVGVLFAAGVFFGFLRNLINKQDSAFTILKFTTLFTFFFLVLSFLLDIPLLKFYEITLQNDSKGNLIGLATNVVLNDGNLKFLLPGIAIGLVVCGVHYKLDDKSNFFERLNRFEVPGALKSKISQNIVIFLIGLLIYRLFIAKVNYGFIVITAIIAITIVFYFSFKRTDRNLSIAYPALGLIYANSMTSDLVAEAMIIIAAPALCLVVDFIRKKTSDSAFKVTVLIFIVLFSIRLFHDKGNTPYSWWGFQQSKITEANFTPPYSLLKGLSVDEATYEVLSEINLAVNALPNSEDRKNVYFYPHMPFFYLLHNKLPPTKNPIQWFDVIRNSDMKKEIDFFKSGHSSDLLVMFDPPINAYLGHKSMKKNQLPQTIFVEQIESLNRAKQYELQKYVFFKNGLQLTQAGWISKKIPITITSDKWNGKSIYEVSSHTGVPESDFEVIEESSSLNGPWNRENFKLVSKGKKMTFVGKPAALEKLVVALGYIEKVQEDWYSLKIYTKTRTHH